MASTHYQSAKILTFPVGGRRSVAKGEKVWAAANTSAPRPVIADYGNWYHQEAVEEEKNSRPAN